VDTTCLECGAPLTCDLGPDCWCARLPFRPMPAEAAGCLCPKCLAAPPPEEEREA